MQFRPTRAIINLKALKHNFSRIIKRIPKGCRLLAMVKADAYGHGVGPIAKTLENLGVAALGVATVEEGVELRQAGIKGKILVMGGLWGQGVEAAKVMLKYGLTPVVHSAGVVQLLEKLALKLKVKGKLHIHLKIDTGMTRLGITLQALPHLLGVLKKSPHLKLEGVMTHLAFRFDTKYTKYQVSIFKKAGEKILTELGKIPVWHIANSAAVIMGNPIEIAGSFAKLRTTSDAIRTTQYAQRFWARPGIMLYGIPPYPEFAKKIPLQPVMSLVSQVSLLKNVPKGTRVSYNGTFTTKRPSRIAVIPIGYADGYPWSASGRAQVLVEGRRCPVLGRVTMDMIMVDVTDCRKVQVGSEVVLLGRQGGEEIRADDLSRWAGTIAYEIVCRISKRMPRIYLN